MNVLWHTGLRFTHKHKADFLDTTSFPFCVDALQRGQGCPLLALVRRALWCLPAPTLFSEIASCDTTAPRKCRAGSGRSPELEGQPEPLTTDLLLELAREPATGDIWSNHRTCSVACQSFCRGCSRCRTRRVGLVPAAWHSSEHRSSCLP